MTGKTCWPPSRGRLAFRRFRAADVRAILAARTGLPRLRQAGQPLAVELPTVPVRALADYAAEGIR